MKDIVVIGDIMIDIVAIIEEEINRGSDTQSNTSMQFGGAAANVATWIGLNNVSCQLIGALGNDVFAELFLRRFQQLGIRTSIFSSTSNTGSVIAISHPDKERSMLSELGANSDVAKAFSHHHISENSVVYLSGYVLFQESNFELVNNIINIAQQKGSVLVVDPASSSPLQKSPRLQLLKWLSEFDYILPNEDELETLINLGYESDAVIFEKRGAEGVTIHRRENSSHLPADDLNVVDTVGAGDAFAAGVLTGLAQGLSDQDAARLGISFASRACQTRGATPAVLDIK
jgi:sugar/nucleoside kinase (ribokinase family)